MSRVPRFRKFGAYPSGYPKSLADNQSAMPSQHNEVPPAFDPARHPDMIPIAPSGVVDQSIVRHVFDSRPPFAYDFFFEDAFRAGVNQLGGYNVPIGWNLFLRKIVIAAYPAATLDLINASDMDPFGNSTASGILQILNNGSPVDDWTIGTVQLFDLTTSDVEIPTFIKIKGGNNLNINIPTFTDLPGGDLYNVLVHYYGNMLLSTGRNIVNEVGNQYPQPVIDVDASKGQPLL